MIYRQTGFITSGLHVLGTPDLPAFLLDAVRPVIVDAGITGMGRTYIRDIRRILNGRQPAYLFLTHVHYDHCGAAALLKKAFPGLQAGCAPAGEKILENPRAIETIRDLNRGGAQYAMASGEIEESESPPDFEPFAVEKPLSDGDTVELGGGLSMEVIATPGHTRDSLSFYVPEKQMLFTGEAVGVMTGDGYVFSEWLSSFEDYWHSMHRLQALDVDLLCIGHGYVLTGGDAAGYIPRAMAHAEKFRESIETYLQETGGDVAAVKQRIKEKEYDPLPDPKQPDFAYLINLEAKIRAVMRLNEA